MAPSTSVIICSRGRADLLWEAATRVLSLHPPPTELVIVDQSDQPDERLVAVAADSAVPVRYDWAPDRGLSRARNRGLATARGDIVAFLDDDMLPQAAWLGALVDALTHADERHVVTGQVPEGPPEVAGARAPSTITESRPRTYTGRPARDVLYAGNMAMFRTAYEAVGPFDERLGAGSQFPAAEDNDYGYRLLKAGYTILYRPEVVAVHRAWRDEGSLTRLKFDYGRGQGGFYAKHIRAGDRHMAWRLTIDVLHHGVRAVRRAARARLRGAGSDLAYTKGVLVGAAGWLRTQ